MRLELGGTTEGRWMTSQKRKSEVSARMELGLWIERCRSLARDLDALGTRYTITVAVGDQVIAEFDSVTTPALPGVEIQHQAGSLNGASPEEPEEEPGGVHTHHFKIETPNGPTSEGVCECGERRAFRNSKEAGHTFEPGERQGPGPKPCVVCGRIARVH